MTVKLTRKRALISGSALLLIAGISAGGATITQNSTIFDNTFGIQSAPVEDGEVTVTGDPMSHKFTLDGIREEFASDGHYDVTNTDDDKTAQVKVASVIDGYGVDANKTRFADSLHARVYVGGKFTGNYNLSNLMGGKSFEIPANSHEEIKVRVLTPSATSAENPWNPGVPEDTEIVVDWEFDWSHPTT